MADKKDEERVMASDPFLEEDAVLRDTFFTPGHAPSAAGAPGNHHHSPVPAMAHGGPKKARPSHYKVVSISLYMDDIDRIDTLVKELKRRGFTKMNRSALIRFAIDTVDIDKLPRQY